MENLTSVRLLSVARRLVSAQHVRSLGLLLGVKDYTIDAALYDHKSEIQEAGYTVLKSWFQGQENHTEAFAKLHRALTHPSVGLSQIINQTFKHTKYLSH